MIDHPLKEACASGIGESDVDAIKLMEILVDAFGDRAVLARKLEAFLLASDS